MSGIFVFFVALIVGLLCLLAMVGIAVVWVYKDAKSRGLNALLWVLVIVFVPNFLGLLIYFLVGRKVGAFTCDHCNQRVNENALYCDYCGSKLDLLNKKKVNPVPHGRRYLIGALLCLMLAFVSFVGGVVSYGLAFDSFDKTYGNKGFGSGYSVGSVCVDVGNKWNVSYLSASKDYVFDSSIKIKEGEPGTLHIQASCKEGEPLLRIQQDDMEDVINLSTIEDSMDFDLSQYKDGKLSLLFETNGSKGVEMKMYWD